MTFIKTEKGYMLRLIRGEKIIETITRFCTDEHIRAGFITGLGAAEQIELGYYNLETKTYHWQTFQPMYEIVSMTGNISLVDEKPFIHIHMSIADEEFHSFGGHLKEAVVGATCEVFITDINIKMERVLDEEIGLKLLNLGKEL